MNPNAAAKGRSFKGAIAYITHDPDQAESDERVLFTHTVNLRTDDTDKAAKVMAYTAMHAGELKAANGTKATGRKTENPVYHVSLSWIPGERPTKAEMIDTGKAALSALGYQDHEAVFAAHGDKEHVHLHLVVSRIHPVTGKAFNPKDDHKLLQGWAHEYDKARGLEWRSPIRAAKHEKDPAKSAEYQAQAKAARAKNGLDKTSSIRPAWKAVNGATHPKSQRFQDIKAAFDKQVKDLAAASRAIGARHKAEWQALQQRQAEARRDLRGRPLQASALQNQFARASSSYGTLLRDRETLKISQRMALRDTAARLKAFHQPKVERFADKQRAERQAFQRQERAGAKQGDRNLALATRTRVGLQGETFRGHLSARFNRDQHQAERRSAFATGQAEAKKAFTDKLAAADQPQFDRLKTGHAARRKSFNQQIRAAARAGAPAGQAALRRDKAVLAIAQREERTTLRQQQGQERAVVQQQWSALNDDRSSAWESYRAHRAGQAAAKAQETRSDRVKDIYQDRAGLAESRQMPSRDYASQPQQGRGQSDSGGGRERTPAPKR